MQVFHLIGPIKFVLIQRERTCRNLNTLTCFAVDLIKMSMKKSIGNLMTCQNSYPAFHLPYNAL